MTRANTNLIYNPNNPNPTLAQGLGSLAGGFQSMKQARLADIAEQNQMLKLQQDQEQAERQKAFRQDFQDMGYTPGVSDPREMTDLYTEHYPELVAQQQFRQQMSGGGQRGKVWQPISNRPGWFFNAYTGEEKYSKQIAESIDPIKQKQLAMKQQKINNAISTQNWKEASTIIDQTRKQDELDFKKLKRTELIDDRLRLNNAEYAQKQSQLLGQLPRVVQNQWQGGAKQGGTDLVAQDVPKISAATEGTSQLLTNTDKLIGLVDKHGLEKLPGEAREVMKTLIGNIALKYKGEEFAGLGVLTGPDLSLLLQITGDPTDFMALSANIQKKKLEEFRRNLLTGYNKKMRINGFNDVSEGELINLGGSLGSINESLSSEEEGWIR